MTTLTAKDWTALRRHYDSEPASRLRVHAYPSLRLRGTVRLPSGQVLKAPVIPIGVPAFTRLWTFAINESGLNVRATGVSPAFVGPATIEELTLYGLAHNQTNPFQKMQVTVSSSPGTQGNNQAAAAVPPGVEIFESTQLPEFSADDGLGSALPFLNGVTGVPVLRISLNYKVTLNPFYINVSFVCRVALQQILQGIVRVSQSVDSAPLA